MVVTVVSLAMLLIGLVAVLLAYEVLGNPGGSGDKKKLLLIHRFFGYGFAAVYLLVLAGMALRFAWIAEFSPTASVHAAIALAVGVLLALKVLMVRRFRKFTANFFAIGTTIFALSCAMVILTAGGEIGRAIAGIQADRGAEPTEEDAAAPSLSSKSPPSERAFVTLCAQCHSLQTPLLAMHYTKTEEQWTATVERMRAKTETISEADGRAVAEYLAGLASP